MPTHENLHKISTCKMFLSTYICKTQLYAPKSDTAQVISEAMIYFQIKLSKPGGKMKCNSTHVSYLYTGKPQTSQLSPGPMVP